LAISETAKDWITESKSKGRALTTYRHTFEITANEESEKREGEITFKSGDKVENVKIYQAGGAILLLSHNEFTISDAGQTISVDIKSNVEYGVQMSDVDWITDLTSSRGMSSHTLKYIIFANKEYDNRSAEIVYYDLNSDLKDTLKIVQAQKDAIVISQKTYDVKAEGETIEVKLSTNVDFEITMPEADWIEQVKSRGLKELTLYFKVAENEGEDSRSAKIKFTNKSSFINEYITINQKSKKEELYYNWKERNQHYIDSIAQVANANLGDEVGKWKVIHTYKFNPPMNNLRPNVNDYVYCKILEKGTGKMSPLFTDTVSTHYRGKLIPLYNGEKVIFDQSFSGELDKDVAVPVSFAVSGVIEGWTTALHFMKEGDRWEVHIPYNLGYGTYGSSSIPSYSTLIFDMSLVKITTHR
jgi:FKBP-type peptidyl-prolyl cis-trans isomerase